MRGPDEIVGVQGRRLAVVVGERVVDRSKPLLAGGHRLDLAVRPTYRQKATT